MEEQSHTIAAVEGQVKTMDEFLKQRAAAEVILSMHNLSQEAGIIWENKIQIINEQQKQWEERNKYTNREVDYQAQLLEQLLITNQTKQDLQSILRKHEGHSSKVISLCWKILVSTYKSTSRGQ